jgi:O-antigen ligase
MKIHPELPGASLRTWQQLALDESINALKLLPFVFAGGAFVLTFLWVAAALPLVIIATALDRYRVDFFGAGLRIEHCVFAGVALAWFLKTRPSWKQFYFSRADLVLVTYVGLVCTSSLLFAPQVGESLKFLALMAFCILLYWLVRALAGGRRAELARGVKTLWAVGVAAALFGIIAWLVFPFGVNLGVQVYRLEDFMTFSPYGTLFDANTLGLYAMAATLLQITLLLDSEFARWRVWLGIGIVITLTAVALSLTRSAWIGLGVGLALILLASPRRRWALAIGGAALALVVLALLFNSALAGGGNALAEFSFARVLTSRSIFFRLDTYGRAWNDFLTSPVLGNGANTFAQKYTSPAGTRDWISNLVLMTLHDTGLAGLILLITWLGWLGLETWRALQVQRGAGRTFLLALSITYLALLVTYQATTVFWLGWNWVYLGLIRAASIVKDGDFTE